MRVLSGRNKGRSGWFAAGLAGWGLLAGAAGAAAGEAGGGSAGAEYQTAGVENGLPVFRDAAVERMRFPLAWSRQRYPDFQDWRDLARAKVRDCLLNPPPEAAWEAVVLAEEDRGGHVARKVVFNLTGDSRVLALMTLPKGRGPFPAVLLLHDHGAKFDIGKEKVIRPWSGDAERAASAQAWVERYYAGRWLGDELADRGYVCLATDALNWGDRGGGGFEGQEKLSSNLLHLGMSLAGVIAWEDLRAAEFLAGQPEVDSRRVAAMGLSMGGFRTWQVAALSDRIGAGVSVCWMNTVAYLMTAGNNQTKGSSAYTMTHPGLLDDLDYPDIASLACPKPMAFYAGTQDSLFPVAGVEAAFAKMRAVWSAQGAGNQLVTRLWEAPHTFNGEMQEAAFAWLDGVLQPGKK